MLLEIYFKILILSCICFITEVLLNQKAIILLQDLYGEISENAASLTAQLPNTAENNIPSIYENSNTSACVEANQQHRKISPPHLSVPTNSSVRNIVSYKITELDYF